MIGDPRLPNNFWSKVVEDDEGCWNWIGAITSRGYGSWSQCGVVASTHRVTYSVLSGPIPEGMTIDHLCLNKLCCNPDHFEVVTRIENARRFHVARQWGVRNGCDCQKRGPHWKHVESPGRVYFSTPQAAAYAGRSLQEVRVAVRLGTLAGHQLGGRGRWRIHRDALDAWLRHEAWSPNVPVIHRNARRSA